MILVIQNNISCEIEVEFWICCSWWWVSLPLMPTLLLCIALPKIEMGTLVSVVKIVKTGPHYFPNRG